jgi:hypothetical protein
MMITMAVIVSTIIIPSRTDEIYSDNKAKECVLIMVYNVIMVNLTLKVIIK